MLVLNVLPWIKMSIYLGCEVHLRAKDHGTMSTFLPVDMSKGLTRASLCLTHLSTQVRVKVKMRFAQSRYTFYRGVSWTSPQGFSQDWASLTYISEFSYTLHFPHFATLFSYISIECTILSLSSTLPCFFEYFQLLWFLLVLNYSVFPLQRAVSFIFSLPISTWSSLSFPKIYFCL